MLTALAGCLSGPTGEPTGTATEACSANDRPKPTASVATPDAYPERPTELSIESVRQFLDAYEHTYRYNEILAAHPDKYGRTNELTVRVEEVSVDGDGDRYTATVSGQLQVDFADGASGSPETPTETPLPAGHGPFEASYVVTGRRLRRDGTVLECW